VNTCIHRIGPCTCFVLLILFCLCPVVSSVALAEEFDYFFYGDIQLRGYGTRNLYPAAAEQPDHSARFGRGRLRLSTDISYADRYHLLLTLRAHAGWGARNHSDFIETAFSKAWFEWMNIGFSPLTLKLGRQSFGFGSGLLLSDDEDEWLYDAMRGTWDALPLVVNIVGGRTAACSRDTDVDQFFWLNTQYETDHSFVPVVELYQGIFDMQHDAQPLLAGIRTVLVDVPKWWVQTEVAYEWGQRMEGHALSAWLLDARIRRRRSIADKQISCMLRYTYASGDHDADGMHQFVDLMNNDQWGHVFKPRLSNIHIISLNGTIGLTPHLQTGLSGYYYIQDKATIQTASRPGYESDGYNLLTDGQHSELGTEVDFFITCQASEQLELQLHAGYFWSGQAYRESSPDDAREIRVEAVLDF